MQIKGKSPRLAVHTSKKISATGKVLSTPRRIGSAGKVLPVSGRIRTTGKALPTSGRIGTPGKVLPDSGTISTTGKVLSDPETISSTGKVLPISEKNSKLSSKSRIGTTGKGSKPCPKSSAGSVGKSSNLSEEHGTSASGLVSKLTLKATRDTSRMGSTSKPTLKTGGDTSGMGRKPTLKTTGDASRNVTAEDTSGMGTKPTLKMAGNTSGMSSKPPLKTTGDVSTKSSKPTLKNAGDTSGMSIIPNSNSVDNTFVFGIEPSSENEAVNESSSFVTVTLIECTESDPDAPVTSTRRTSKRSGKDKATKKSLSKKSASTADEISKTSTSKTSSKTGGSPSSSEPTSCLPPCRICGDQASGFHYGANTCEACKGFFRRCLKRKKDIFVCSGNKNCPLNPETKGLCGYCRYQKCLDVGMSKTAIKTGRYTLERKSDYIKEVNTLKGKPSDENQMLLGNNTASNTVEAPEAVATVVVIQESDVTQNGPATQKRVADSESPEAVPRSDVGEVTASKKVRLDGPEDATEMEKIALTMTELFKKYTPLSEEILAKVPENQAKYLENKATLEDLFGPMEPLSRKEYFSILQETGLDIDGRLEWANNTLFPSIDQSIRKYTHFSRDVPGYRKLPSADRIALLKASTFEWWLLTSFRAVDCDRQLTTNHFGETQSRDDMLKFGRRKAFLDDYFRIAKMLQKINPDYTEIALLMGIILLSRDRTELQAPDQVELCQKTLVSALQHHVTASRDQPGTHFARLMTVMTEARTPSYHHTALKSKLIGKIKESQPPVAAPLSTFPEPWPSS